MIERTGRLCFLLKAIQPISILGKRSWQNLDRYIAPEHGIARAIDLTHSAFADLGDDRVLSDRCVGGNGFAHRALSTDYAENLERRLANSTGYEGIGLEISEARSAEMNSPD